MIRLSLPLSIAALAAPAAAVPEDGRAVVLAQRTFQQRIIIRVPRLPVGRTPLPDPVRYKEGKGPACVTAGALAGAAVNGDTVDLVLTGGTRVRAQLAGGCAPMDFYSGFYIRPSADGRVCAGRDAIRARSGASCRINRFRSLTIRR